MEIYYSPGFERSIKKINYKLKDLVRLKQAVFKDDCFDPSLDTHKLHGKLNNFWSFSINNKIRVVFEFLDKNKIVFIDIGSHSIYK